MNDLTIPLEGVSARHGTIHVDADGELVFTDLDSVGGSSLVGERGPVAVTGPIRVAEGDLIRLANSATIRLLAAKETAKAEITRLELPTTPVGALGAVFAAKLAQFALVQARRRDVATFLGAVRHLVADTLSVEVIAVRMLRRGDGSQPERLEELDEHDNLRRSDQTAGFHDSGRNELMVLIQEGGLVFHALERGTRLIVSGAGAAQPGSLALVLDVAVDDLVDDDLDDFAGLLAQLAPFVDGLSEEARRNRAEAQLLAENHYFRERQRRHYLFKELVAESVSMRACYLSLSRFVETDEPVLIRGEAGTGKELIARAIHHLGHRSAGLMVAQNCDEIDEALLDAELFGAAKGTLGEARLGILELADGGTVYLGEVDRLSLLLQGKLLRVIKEGEIRRHGEELARAVNVRLVLSTHRPLGDLVAAGAFRKDLLVGLDSVLDVPPLRDRRGDIIPLTELFLGIFSKRYGVVEPKLSPSLAEALRAYEWRGNVRELQTAVEAAVLKSAGRELRVEDFGF